MVLLAGGCVALPSSVLAGAPTVTCHGLPTTVSRHAGVVRGTAGSDVIRLNAPGRVLAGPGRDVICGSDGPDSIDAGPGDDVVLGRGGNDRLRGGTGQDVLFGDTGNDRIEGGAGRDIIMGGQGADETTRVRSAAIAVAGEKILSADGDQLMPGSQGVSFVLSNFATLRTLANSGRRVAAAWGDGGTTVVAAQFDLRENNSAGFTGRLFVYLAPGDGRGGSTLAPDLSPFVPLGGRVLFTRRSVSFGPSLGPDVIGASYAIEAGGEAVVSGLGQATLINGAMFPLSIMSASLVIPPATRVPEARLKPPGTLTLFVAPQAGTNPGAVWDTPLPAPNITFPVTPASVKAISYDAVGGFRSD